MARGGTWTRSSCRPSACPTLRHALCTNCTHTLPSCCLWNALHPTQAMFQTVCHDVKWLELFSLGTFADTLRGSCVNGSIAGMRNMLCGGLTTSGTRRCARNSESTTALRLDARSSMVDLLEICIVATIPLLISATKSATMWSRLAQCGPSFMMCTSSKFSQSSHDDTRAKITLYTLHLCLSRGLCGIQTLRSGWQAVI